MANTPLTELACYAAPSRRIFVKHEYLGPTGSVKDRMVERVLACATNEGDLRTGMEIVEASSGNTGAALARAGSRLGFNVRIFVASSVATEKIQTIKSFGAEVHEVDIEQGQVSEVQCAANYAHETGGYLFNQFGNRHHVDAYKETLGAEILSQLESEKIIIEHFVGGVGSGGSVRAVGELLRERHNESLKVWATVPAVYPSDIEGLNPGHLRNEGHFKIWLDRSPDFETGLIEVNDEDAFREILSLKNAAGIYVGPASGSCLHVARQLSGNILIVLTDTGLKYSTKISAWLRNLSV